MKEKQKWYKTDLFYILVSYLTLFVLLTTIAVIIINSNCKSSASNDAWLGYLGSMFGASVGAMAAGISLIKTLNENRKARKQDVIEKVKPYLYVKCCNINTLNIENNKIWDINFKIINLGLGPAFNIKLKHKDNDLDVGQINNLSEQDSSIYMIQEKLTFSASTKLENTTTIETFEITYYDMYENQYSQTVEMNFTNNSSKCSPPKLINSKNNN